MSFMFKHWFEDDPDYVDEDPPKMRENELHNPNFNKKFSVGGDLQVTTSCSVCGNVLVRSGWYDKDCEDILLREAIEKMKNYCPYCGARLKKIEK